MSESFDFEICRKLGQGAASEVWLATHLGSGRDVAIKVFKTEDDHAQDVEQFLRETRLVARSAHPNILQVYGYGRCPRAVFFNQEQVLYEGQLYLVSEYVSGGSLSSRLGHLEWSEISEILQDVLTGLARVHGRGIVHLDLKPENILFADRGAVIADFGIAKALGASGHDLTGHGIFGTPNFMAPEQGVSYRHLYGPWTDLYSVGCLAHSLITGRPIYERDNLIDVLLAHRMDPIPRLEGRFAVPEGLDLWLMRMLDKSWNERFHRASEALRYLRVLGDRVPDVSVAPRVPSTMVGGEHTIRLDSATSQNTLMSPVPRMDVSMEMDKTGLPQVNFEHLSWTLAPTQVQVHPLLTDLSGALIAFEASPLIGRSVEKRVLWEAFRQTCDRRQLTCWTIKGEAGIGKSAICEWLAMTAHEQVDAEVLSFTHQSSMGVHDGVMGAFKLMFSLERVSKERYAKIISERLALPISDPLCEDVAAVFEMTETDESTLGSQQMMSIKERWIIWARLLAHLAEKRPFIVIVDDVQWASDALSFLDLYCRFLQAKPLLILGTIREDTPFTGRAAEHLSSLQDMLDGQELRLGNIDAQSIASWLAQTTTLGESVAQKLVAASRGNPLSMKALVLTAIHDDQDRDMPVYSSLEGLLKRRYAMWKTRASDETIWALELLAVLGRRSLVDEFQMVARRLDLVEELNVLDDAVRGQFVEFEHQYFIAFVHEKYVVIILDSLTRERRAQLNEAVGRMLLDNINPDHGRAATYFQDAQLYEEAAAHWMQAALLHRDLTDYPNLRASLLRSAVCLRHAQVPRMDRRWLMLSAFWVLCSRVMGQSASVEPRIVRLCTLIHAHDDHELKAMVYKERARVERIRRTAAAGVAFMKLGLESAEESGNLALEGDLRVNYVEFLFFVGAHADCAAQIPMIERLIDVSGDALDNRLYLCERVAALKGMLARAQERPEEALACALETLKFAQESMSKVRLTNAHNVLGEAYRRLGRFEEACAEYERSSVIGEQYGSVDADVPVFNRMMIELHLGNYGNAQLLIDRIRRKPLQPNSLVSQLLKTVDVAIHFYRGDFNRVDENEAWLKALATVRWIELDLVEIVLPLAKLCGASGDIKRGRWFFDILVNQNKHLNSDSVGLEIAVLEKILENR